MRVGKKEVTTMATGAQWNEHFLTLDQARKRELAKALSTLRDDPMFYQNYGPDFKELKYLLECPLRKSP